MSAAQLRSLLPQRSDYAELPRSWRRDLLAGVTVGVVALPLALGFGIASGLGATAGLITAIVAGVLAAVFGGSHLQVSGPTGAMTVVLAPIVADQGVSGVAIVTLLAGLVLVGCAIARIGRFVSFLPWPVIEGFTVGIGLIIFLQQIPLALGVEAEVGENTALAAAHALGDIATVNWQALALTGLVALLMVLLPRLHRTLPASLAAVAVATLAAYLLNLDVATIGAIPSSLPAPSLPGVDISAMRGMIGAVIAIAALAAVESLLSARVADGMADGEAHDPDRELFGQGIANVGSSLFGGMPATGAIARTAVNVRAGGRTRVSAAAHAVLLLAVVFVLSPLIAEIPLAALAGVLMVTAVHMVEFSSVRRVLRSTRSDALVLATTAGATVIFDLVVAVEIGIVLAGVMALRQVVITTKFEPDDLSGESIDFDTEDRLLHEHIVTYRIDGALFFGAAERFLMELTDISDVDYVVLRLGQMQVLDATGAQALAELVDRLRGRGIIVLLACLRQRHRVLLEEVADVDAIFAPSIHAALDEIKRINDGETTESSEAPESPAKLVYS